MTGQETAVARQRSNGTMMTIKSEMNQAGNDATSDWLNDERVPVFICGMPKSGTTLIVSLFDSHPEVLSFPEETKFLKDNPKCASLELMYESLAKFKHDIKNTKSDKRDYRHIDYEIFKETMWDYWHRSPQERKDILTAAILAYGVQTGQAEKKYWLEKSTRNELHLDRAKKMWPKLKAIYIARDPRDNFSSYRIHCHGRKRDLQLTHFVREWLRSMNAWRKYSTKFGDGLVIRYDQLVDNPRKTMQKVADLVGIEWNESLLSPTFNGGAWKGNSMHNVKHAGITNQSMRNFSDQLEQHEIDYLERWLRKYFKASGWKFDQANNSLHKALISLTKDEYGSLLSRYQLLKQYAESSWADFRYGRDQYVGTA